MNPLVQIASLWAASREDVAAAPRVRTLRLSVTDRCNFRCRYCMPVEGVVKLNHGDLLPLEELVRLTAWLADHAGIERVRLTGGEPLVRRGIETLVAGLVEVAEIREVTLTTNGTLLARKAWSLKRAGLKRVNVSLDSLDRERFAEVTRGGSLAATLEGIAAACEAGLTPIKLNTVLRRSTWKREVPGLLSYAAETGFEVRFIELMRTGTEKLWCEREFVSVDEVIRSLMPDVAPVDEEQRGAARRTIVDWRGTPVRVGWITPRSRPFCSRCDRLRMDARGQVRRCLMDGEQLDLARILASAGAQEAIEEFNHYMAAKVPPRSMDSSLAMSQIGG